MPDAPAPNTDLAYADTLWKSADALRGQIDAAEYKHVVLGLLFLKYISDSFEARRGELKAELEGDGIKGKQLDSLLENRDEYTAERVFWVPPEARWPNLQNQATRPDIATLIDDAILAVERDNPTLKSKLPRDYARRGIEPVKLTKLINEVISKIGFKEDRGKARDTLGRVYEYFLGKFAAAEGKLGGEFYTPRCVVRTLVEMIEPYQGRVFDPCCGSAGMFVQSERFVEAHGGNRTDISIFGQESNPTTWRLAHMNLAIRGIEANLGSQPADTFLRNLHPDLRADFILANPPFNVSDWSGQLLRDDARWRYGPPPVGNANYAWIQHFIHHLATPNGRGGGVAGFVMANGSLSSNSAARATSASGSSKPTWWTASSRCPRSSSSPPASPSACGSSPATSPAATSRRVAPTAPAAARARRSSSTPASSARWKPARSAASPAVTMAKPGSPTAWVIHTRPPTSAASSTPSASGAASPSPSGGPTASTARGTSSRCPASPRPPRLRRSRSTASCSPPGRYVGAEEQEADGEPFTEKYPRLLAELEEHFAESERLTQVIRENLRRVGNGA
jgi:type I restriction enzyme M protein